MSPGNLVSLGPGGMEAPCGEHRFVESKASILIIVRCLADILEVSVLTFTELCIALPYMLPIEKYPLDLLPLTKPVPFEVEMRSNFLRPKSFPVGIFFSERMPLVC